MANPEINNIEIKNIGIKNLKLDVHNPRLPNWVTSGGEQEIINFLLREENTLDVIQSIATNGYFAGEPILVIPDDQDESKFIVVEGNRRLSALKILHDTSLGEAKKGSVAKIVNDARYQPPKSIPCVFFERRDEVLNYLGYRHVTGVQSWDSLAKARYVKQLFVRLGDVNGLEEKCLQLARTIGSGSRSDYVKRLLCGLKLYEKIEENDFFDKEIKEKDIYFSIITTALAYKNIYEYLHLDSPGDLETNNLSEEHLRDLTLWMFKKGAGNKTTLGESRNISKLAHVVSSPEAIKQLKSGRDLEECFLLSGEGVTSIISDAIDKAYNQIALAERYATSKTRLSEETATQLNNIIELGRTIRKKTKPDDD